LYLVDGLGLIPAFYGLAEDCYVNTIPKGR